MLDYFKNKLPFSSASKAFSNQLYKIMIDFDKRITQETNPNNGYYNNELLAFIFVLGRFTIQSSDLSDLEKRRLMEDLMIEYALKIDLTKILSNNTDKQKDYTTAMEFLLSRVALYQSLEDKGDFRVRLFEATHCFFKVSGFAGASKKLAAKCIQFAMNSFLELLKLINTLKQEYRFTNVISQDKERRAISAFSSALVP